MNPSPPEKSSDEILKELFGLCQQQFNVCSNASSQESDSYGSDDEEDSRSRKHKHKRKKKKHKKAKKRKHESIDDEDLDNEGRKRRLRKIKKEPGVDVECSSAPKVELKIKTEKDAVENLNKQPSAGEFSQNKENKSNNYVNTITGKRLTLDDVFNHLGIVTEGQTSSKIKQEKIQDEATSSRIKQEEEFVLLRPEQIKKEKLDDEGEVQCVKNEKETDGEPDSKQALCEIQEFVDSDIPAGSEKPSMSEVFTDELDKLALGSKKICIKNLKNSHIYEATMKEIEEREKHRAEKYEEGELSTDSNSSEDDSVDLNTKDENSSANHSKSQDERKKRHKTHEKKKKHRSHSSKKKHRHNGDRSERKSDRKHKRLDSDHQSKSESLKSHTHHHSERARSLSVESETSLASRRSRRSTHRSREEKRSRERSPSRSRTRTKANHFKSEYERVEKIDKQKLLEIARKNAISLLQQGAIPASVLASKSKITSIKAGGKTVDELTDFCKQLSRKEAEGDDSDRFSSGSESGDTKIAFHHPFQLKERPPSIIMNIRNAISLPTKTAQEKTLELSKQLSLQYPVSSGQQHQSEWVPVEKNDSVVSTHTSSSYSNALVDPTAMVAYPLPKTATHQLPGQYQPPLPQTDSILPPPKQIDISSIVAQRLEAIRRLNENPQDPIGTNLIQTANTKMTVWAGSKVQPGFFTGSTGVKPLSVAELSGGYRAWPKKNQLITAKPVSSDKGEALMKKMGWQPGKGLGKYEQGPAAPCAISLKTDRKGLAEQPIPKGFRQSSTLQAAIEIAQNKHPVSMLNEYCSRRKLPIPQYDCEEKEGMGKRKLFLFSVTIQGMRYTPKMPSTNKKQSKMEAATVCLQSLGLLPIVPPTVTK